ncbi:MAG: hypothetical protein DRJ14_08660 [Acidobacteria bacterium]|nr:MAG: hypothetical protein DRJ14_08660 [Acidobacteriota bacterium]
MFAVRARAGWSGYKPGKIADIIEANKSTAEGCKFVFSGKRFPTLASALTWGRFGVSLRKSSIFCTST